VVEDKMVAIDRESQTLLLESKTRLAYDLLILTPGLQYQDVHIPLYTPDDDSDDEVDDDNDSTPPQAMAYSTADDGSDLLDWIASDFLPAGDGTLLVLVWGFSPFLLL
jgi:hypothetical protein